MNPLSYVATRISTQLSSQLIRQEFASVLGISFCCAFSSSLHRASRSARGEILGLHGLLSRMCTALLRCKAQQVVQAFQIPRNILELFKVPCRHLMLHHLILRFFVYLIVFPNCYHPLRQLQCQLVAADVFQQTALEKGYSH